jgi:hypothetical protein
VTSFSFPTNIFNAFLGADNNSSLAKHHKTFASANAFAPLMVSKSGSQDLLRDLPEVLLLFFIF